MLMAEPMKKRKKADPALTKLRDERKRKRLWRDVKRLMRSQNQLKPLDELEVPYSLVDEPQKYARPKAQISDDLFCEREDLRQEWSIYKAKRHTQDLQMIERIEDAQEKALEELRLASPTLFDEAVKVDEAFLPFTVNATTLTPPIKDFDSPQGDYKDCTKTWESFYVPEVDKKLRKQRAAARDAEWSKMKKEKQEKAAK